MEYTESSIYYIKNQCIELQQKCNKLINDTKIFDKICSIMKYMLANPILLVGFIIITATLIIPITLFTIFATINVGIAFTGFVIIEVMLLMIGMTVICCIMFFIITTALITATTFILLFYITYFSFSLVKKKLLLIIYQYYKHTS